MEATAFVEEGNGNPCMDDNYMCSEWAGMGECNANPAYMLSNCRRACVVCLEDT